MQRADKRKGEIKMVDRIPDRCINGCEVKLGDDIAIAATCGECKITYIRKDAEPRFYQAALEAHGLVPKQEDDNVVL